MKLFHCLMVDIVKMMSLFKGRHCECEIVSLFKGRHCEIRYIH